MSIWFLFLYRWYALSLRNLLKCFLCLWCCIVDWPLPLPHFPWSTRQSYPLGDLLTGLPTWALLFPATVSFSCNYLAEELGWRGWSGRMNAQGIASLPALAVICYHVITLGWHWADATVFRPWRGNGMGNNWPEQCKREKRATFPSTKLPFLMPSSLHL